ncbi:uncharacterized protein LOC143555919 [Bidens hawaiensis]|uniref:uncharacterized protein LOC143555919 n=1 Tax=Bidens hawaiensis TaxID=980011 RepID=UPI0040490BA1
MLMKRHVGVNIVACPLCGDHEETVEHLFVACGFAQVIWTVVAQWCKIQDMFAFSYKDILDIHKYEKRSVKWKKVVNAINITTIWSIWKARNDTVFENKEALIQRTIGEIKAISFLWVKARSKNTALNWEIWRRFDLQFVGW